MLGYVQYALHKIQHPTQTRPQNSPHQWTEPSNGYTAPQLAHPKENFQELNPYETINVQQFVGTFFVICMLSQPKNSSHTEHNCS